MITSLNFLHRDSCSLDAWNIFYEDNFPGNQHCNINERITQINSDQISIYRCYFSNLINRAVNIQKKNLNMVHGYCTFINNSLTDPYDKAENSRGACIYFSGENSRIGEYRFCARDCHLYRIGNAKYSAGYVTSIQSSAGSVENQTIIDSTIANCGDENEGLGTIHEDNLMNIKIERINVSSVTSYFLPVGYTDNRKADDFKYCNFINNRISPGRTEENECIYNAHISSEITFYYSNFINNSIRNCGIGNILFIKSYKASFIGCSFIRGDYDCKFFQKDKEIYMDSCYNEFDKEVASITAQNKIENSISIYENYKCFGYRKDSIILIKQPNKTHFIAKVLMTLQNIYSKRCKC